MQMVFLISTTIIITTGVKEVIIKAELLEDVPPMEDQVKMVDLEDLTAMDQVGCTERLDSSSRGRTLHPIWDTKVGEVVVMAVLQVEPMRLVHMVVARSPRLVVDSSLVACLVVLNPLLMVTCSSQQHNM